MDAHIVEQQLDFLEDFDAFERRRKARHALIDQITAEECVKEILHALADLPQVADEFGNSHVTVGIRRIGAMLKPKQKARKGKECKGRSRNTVREELKQSIASGYLQLLNPDTDDDERTYIIPWKSIVDRKPNPKVERAADSTVTLEPSTRAADSTADDEIRNAKGGQSSPPRGSIPIPEGVNFDAEGGQFDRVNSPQTPSENLLPKEQISNSLLLSSKPSEPSSMSVPRSARGSNHSNRRHEARERTRAVCWPLWERAVSASNLADPEHVQKLFAIAVELAIVENSEVHRFHVFCQAAKQIRMCRTKQAKSRFGLFVSNVAQNNWMRNDEDEDTARMMIARVDLNRPSDRDDDIEMACVGAVQSVPAEAQPLTKEQCDAKKDVIRLRLIEKFPDLFGLPY